MKQGCHLLTGEFPPQLGGVSDYTFHVAHGLAGMGHEVHVWCPAVPGAPESEAGPVSVHRVCGGFTPADLQRLGSELDRMPGPRRIFLQWVPHSFGYLSMNFAFCWWVYRRARKGDVIELMVHEPFLSFREGSLKQDAAAAVHRVMVSLLLRAARRVWCAIPDWQRRLAPFAPSPGPEFHWLPVPSNIPVVDNSTAVARIRSSNHMVLGHFGTYNKPISAWLMNSLPAFLAQEPSLRFLALGGGSNLFAKEFLERHPQLRERVTASGALPADLLSAHLQACDVMVQPYPAGINSRQGSAMACLAHSRPTVSTRGPVTEPVWEESGGVRLGTFDQPQTLLRHLSALCRDERGRSELASRGRQLYRDHFDLSHTLEALSKACAS